jgi:hypothetical protein
MSARRRSPGRLVLAAVIVLAAAPPLLRPAPAPASGIPSARLAGQFQLSGRVTVAQHISGEHHGDRVTRSWTFTALCPAGPCSQVQLVRQRAGGTDTTVLDATGPTTYAGRGRFYAPLRCGGRVRPRGESVPFTVTVTVTTAEVVLGVPVANAIHATYVNSHRRNLTKCVEVPGHDAAVYDGQLVSGAAT